MSRHEGVSCDSCLKSNFNGRRYKCLICYDYDLCADCYEDGVTSTRHLVDHPMQCILTRSDIELFFGGEMLNSEQPQSFTCPYCKKMGFSDATLLEHVSAEHTETSLEVVCPVCAGLPGGEPNLVTDDFAGHLTLEHRTGPRELISFLDEPSAIRHGGGVRRIPGRTLGGPRARRSNMHFSSSSGLSALSPSGRESVDPIAELLSQLSGVRRGGPQTSQLQQLQMQIQLERQQVTATRQQLERLPRRAHPMVSSSNSNATMPEVISSGPILSGSGSGGSGGSGASGSGSLNGGGGSSCRTNEWTVNPSLAAQQQSQSGLTGNAGINNRESGGGSGNVNGSSGSNANNILGMSIAGGAVGTGVNSASNGADVQSQFLLTKFMQPTLSDTEWAEMERERSDRSQFVQALVLSTLSYDSLDTIAIGGGETERDNRGESQETNSDNVNNEKVSAANTKSDANARESLMNNNTDASAQTTNTSGSSSVSAGTMPGSGRQQVHQQQQTTPEDIADEYKQLQQQQQQAQQQTYASKKKSTSNSGVSGGAGGTGGKPTADRGIERRGRPPPPPVGGGAAAAGSQPQQQHSR
ncbi:E3 ubiquitin-protein ligase Kcmf1 [Bactrocera neohumeralis]|uniref:E3 ubiquitin-protein ligase Kcmf1 n=1 Tax=Bactrocera neohumeralis TaxID=98809 RepID=UPI0021656F68|nr:E3 ubiquitin-protein ligase Kcmf1 [Bactrocera neohumeralis]XP_050341716.1 E3 ubiquitin-protein ligase Kcmf1 [Bactrocera neohumeralis]XP_050341717.1 E3 ubiquitin-protein ligase Kcmf1 [Bactrocera neohumeralis]XP_050341718.1 E3 ubiquitin-protein ligase Kcmf1 [Bactrocera neohumeralis]XP_050341719.1 E3 ubiquitin-protein ligase Kcmf1 [Bactrocera neohumeralis]XP_050341721.1 E3 ubiquitin-protein ligase Kcmf1 [Bactrocera neohumeralis]XP_050341722.1 E3 ubiquitin-protein ligase Kcmf1 [Bactrocera neoh